MGREQRRILLKQTMAAISRDGMSLRASPSDQSWAVIAATRTMIDILNGHAPNRASKAAEWAHAFFENSLAHNRSEVKIECAKGCAFCCHVSVSALAPEVFLIAKTIRAQPNFDAQLARIRSRARAAHGLSGFERARLKLPCALLENNLCTVYAARPGPCRGMTSASVKTCEAAFKGANVAIPTPMVWTVLRNAHLQAMWAALTAVELPSDSYDLNEAICLALEQPDAEGRWLKGDDVFKDVARLRIDSPQIAENNRKVIATLIAGALGKELPT